jgi:hypothetical protein
VNSFLIIIIIGSVLGSTSLVNAAAKNGFLNSGLTRSVAGGSAAIASSNFMVGYTNLETFISAAANGSLGLAGFFFIGGLAALLITWAGNLIEFGVAVK